MASFIFTQLYLFIVILLFESFSQEIKYKYNICALPKHRKLCKELQHENNIKCIILVDEASCLAKIESGHLDFASVSAEAAFLAAPFSNNVRVLAKILESGADYKYEIVVLTNKPVNSFDELRGFSYCHPGLNTTDISPYLLQELESKILDATGGKSKDCDNSLTVAENYIKKLNDFFGPSCRHGRWVQDEKLDAKLKNDYKKLTSRCNVEPTVADEKNYLKRSFECLRNAQEPAIAISTVNTVTNGTGLHYLCKNGTTSQTPCVWAQQPYRLIVANKSADFGDELLEDFKAWFSDNYKPSDPPDQSGSTPKVSLKKNEIDILKQILEISEVDNFVNISKFLMKYARELRSIPTREQAKLCKRSTKWCTISELEQKKCEWLSQASLNLGIQPVVDCEQRSSRIECIQAISEDKADVVMIEADLGYVARKKDLSAIAFPQTDDGQEIRTVLVVNSTSGINKLEDIKGKRGCFSRYGDMAWVSFFVAMGGTSNYEKIVGPSCMPLTKNPLLHNIYQIPDGAKETICALCNRKTCDTESDTRFFYGDNGILSCLQHGDFAVFSKPVNFSIPAGSRILCKNGTLAPEGQTNVDDNCYLSVLTTSEVVTRREDTKNRDIQLELLEFDHWFHEPVRDSPFRLFDSFHEHTDLLFKDSTPGLDLPTSERAAVKNSMTLFKKDAESDVGGGGSHIAVIIIVVIIVIIVAAVGIWYYKRRNSRTRR